jgi:hypothetical protein
MGLAGVGEPLSRPRDWHADCNIISMLATGIEEVPTMDERVRTNANVVLWVVVLSFLLLVSWLSGFPWNWW